jgi:hypothetical protein
MSVLLQPFEVHGGDVTHVEGHQHETFLRGPAQLGLSYLPRRPASGVAGATDPEQVAEKGARLRLSAAS